MGKMPLRLILTYLGDAFACTNYLINFYENPFLYFCFTYVPTIPRQSPESVGPVSRPLLPSLTIKLLKHVYLKVDPTIRIRIFVI